MKKYAIKFEYIFFCHWRTHTLYAYDEETKTNILTDIEKNGWKLLEIKELQ